MWVSVDTFKDKSGQTMVLQQKTRPLEKELHYMHKHRVVHIKELL